MKHGRKLKRPYCAVFWKIWKGHKAPLQTVTDRNALKGSIFDFDI